MPPWDTTNVNGVALLVEVTLQFVLIELNWILCPQRFLFRKKKKKQDTVQHLDLRITGEIFWFHEEAYMEVIVRKVKFKVKVVAARKGSWQFIPVSPLFNSASLKM